MQQNPPPLAENLARALSQDYFITILVSSQTKGKYKSMNLPFGLGKTNLAIWLSYTLHGGKSGEPDDPIWTEVFDHLFYYPSKLMKALVPDDGKPPKFKIPAAIYDDVQFTAPAAQSVPQVVRDFAADITTERPALSILILTSPNMNNMAAPIRKLVTYELIVSERGFYEVQQVTYHKNYKNPLMDKVQLDFVEGKKPEDCVEGEIPTIFPQLAPEIQKRYDEWRASEKRAKQMRLVERLSKYERAMEGIKNETLPRDEIVCDNCGKSFDNHYNFKAHKCKVPAIPRSA